MNTNPNPALFTSRHCPCKLCGKTTLHVISKICDRCMAAPADETKAVSDCPRCGCGPCEGCLPAASEADQYWSGAGKEW